MYISVIGVQQGAGFATLARHSWSKYAIHRVVWSLFAEKPGEKQSRNFLYRQDVKNGLPVFYVVSETLPKNTSDVWDITTKEYAPKLRAGQRLGFSLRANPTTMKPDDEGKEHRHSVIKEAIYNLKKVGIPRYEMPTVAEIVQYEGVDWLKKKGESNGFEVQEGKVTTAGYKDEKFYKPNGQHTISITTVDFSGVLTVTDPEAFTKMLYTGMGTGKGFGCGLMLVRPV